VAYTSDDYADLATTTLKNLERTTWADIVVDNQVHHAMPRLLRKKKVVFGSGTGYQWNVRLFSNNAARNVRLNETDAPTTTDTQKTGSVPWRHTTTHWALEERIISMNRSPSRLVSLLQTSRVDAMTDLAELMEANFWGKPSGSSDETTPFGVFYWLVYNSSADGFEGGNPDGFSDGAGGLDSTEHARWRNWSTKYSSISHSDLVRKWREASVKTGFKPPVDGPFNNMKSDYAYYTNYTVIGTLEELLEQRNDNLGNDVASKDGLTTFRRTPVEWVPYLDNNVDGSTYPDSTNPVSDPVIGLNWSVFKPCFLSGEYMKETKVKPHPFSHRMLVQYTDLSYNFYVHDRRRNFILSK